MEQRQSARRRVRMIDTPVSNDTQCDLDTPCDEPLVCDLERETCVQRPQDTSDVLEIIWEGFPVIGRAEVIEAVVKEKFLGWVETTCDFGQDVMEGENYGNLLLSEAEELTGRKVISFIDTETSQILCENREDLLSYWDNSSHISSIYQNGIYQGRVSTIYTFTTFWKNRYIDQTGVDKIRESNLSLFLLAPTQYQVHPYWLSDFFTLYHVIPVGDERPRPLSSREELTDEQLRAEILERGREVRESQLAYFEEKDIQPPLQQIPFTLVVEPALNLSHRRLTTLPEESLVEGLRTLNLSFNNLTEISETIGNLTSLEVLNLDYNHLTTLPETIGNLTSLRLLRLMANEISTLPETIGNLVSLQRLDIRCNRLTILPLSLLELPNLSEVDLEQNPIQDFYVITRLRERGVIVHHSVPRAPVRRIYVDDDDDYYS